MNNKSITFNLYHPICALAYFVSVISFVMIGFQPVLTSIFFISGLSYSFYLKGWRTTCRSLTWQLPMMLLIMVINPLFSAAGSTELFRIGVMAIYAESLFYGLFMGMMLVSMILWLECTNKVISQEKLMSLAAGILPTVTLMISMATRMVPMLKRRSTEIKNVQNACSSANMENSNLQQNTKVISVLMGWSMEDSLQMADSMKISGWGSTKKRTTYTLYRFRKRDAALLLIIIAFAIICGILSWIACDSFTFYPKIEGLNAWVGYIPIALYAFFPLLLELLSNAFGNN